jgi:putative addiction module CopG family antidote
MNLSIPSELQRFIDAKVRSGAYVSPEEVIADALTRWKAEEEMEGAELRRLVAEGQAEADRGEFVSVAEVFGEIRDKSRLRREA